MTEGISAGKEVRRRRRTTALPGLFTALDGVVLFTLVLLTAGMIWILGGNRWWIMMPLIALSLVAAGAFVWRFFISRYRHDIVVPPGGIVSLVFLLYLGVRAPFSEIPYESWQEFFRFASYVLAYWMGVNVLRYNRRWRWTLILLMLSVSVMAWYALIQEAQGTRMAFLAERHSDYGMRASGAYICPNHFAHLLHMVMLVGLGIVAAPGIGVPIKLFAGYTVLIGLYPLFLSLSRSGWLGWMAGVVVFALLMALRRSRKMFLMMLILAPLAAGAAGFVVWKISPSVQARVDQAVKGDVRIPLWKDSLKIAIDAPWLGHGTGTYRHIFHAYHEHMTKNRDPEFAHNDYLHFWSEIGAAGLLIAGLLVLAIMMRAFRILLKSTDDEHAALMAGLLAMIAGTAIHTFFDFNFNIFGNVQVYLFLIAACFAATFDGKRDRVVSLANRTAPALGFFLLLLLGVGLYVHGRMMMSYYAEMRGERAAMTKDWDDAWRNYRKAVAWAPDNWRAHLGIANTRRVQAFWMRKPEIRDPWLDEAIEHYQAAIRMNPWSAAADYGLGAVYRLKDEPEKALFSLRSAIDKSPKMAFYHQELGHQLRNMQRYEEALSAFEYSMQLDPAPIAETNIQLIRRWIAAREARATGANP